jgi:hypothetical protein
MSPFNRFTYTFNVFDWKPLALTLTLSFILILILILTLALTLTRPYF